MRFHHFKIVVLHHSAVVKIQICTESASMLGLGLDGSMLDPNRVTAKDVKSTYLLLLCQMRDINWPQTGETHYHAQLGLLDKVMHSKGWLSAMQYG